MFNLTRIITLAVVALAIHGCGKSSGGHDTNALPWGPKQLTQLSVGPYTIPIPDHWRAISELDDPSVTMPAGVVAMTPERLDHGGMRANMTFAWAPVSTTALPTCDQLADQVAKGQQGTASEIVKLPIDADALACRWRFATSDGGGMELARITGDHELVATWTRMKSLGNEDAEGDARVWQQTLAVLHAPKL